MKYELSVSPEAEKDIRQAYSWYEERRVGLGENFLLCIEAYLSQIQHNPQQYSYIHKAIRRVLVRRFPYAIFYIVSSQAIMVIAVFHCSRHPKTWRNRIIKMENDND